MGGFNYDRAMPLEDRVFDMALNRLGDVIASVGDVREQIAALSGERQTRSDKQFSDEDRAAVAEILRRLKETSADYLFDSVKRMLKAVVEGDEGKMDDCTSVPCSPARDDLLQGPSERSGFKTRPGGGGGRRRPRQA